MRLFVAVDIGDVSPLLPLLARLSKERLLRAVGRDNLHITLKFLGEVAAGAVGDVRAALGAVASRFEPFTAKLGPAGRFGGRASPRVLFLSVSEGERELSALAEAVDAALAERGFARDERAFRPHLTLARGKGGSSSPWFESVRADHAFAVDDLLLVESRLTPAGARHRAVARFALGSPSRRRFS